MNFVTKWFASRAVREFLEVPMLRGYKTYIVGTLIALINLAATFNWIPVDLAHDVTRFLEGLGLITLRDAVANPTTK